MRLELRIITSRPLTRDGVETKRAFVRAHAEEIGGLDVETVITVLMKGDAERLLQAGA